MKQINARVYLSKSSSKSNSWAYAGRSHGEIVTLIYVRKDRVKKPVKFMDISLTVSEG